VFFQQSTESKGEQNVVVLAVRPQAVALRLEPEQVKRAIETAELGTLRVSVRHARKPTIITTNLDYSEWGRFLGNKALVDALLSRLRHQCHTVKIDGPSLRDATG